MKKIGLAHFFPTLIVMLMSLNTAIARIPDDPSGGSKSVSCSENSNACKNNKNIVIKRTHDSHPKRIIKKIKDELLELDVDFDVKLFDLDLIDGIGISLKYQYDLEPSYYKGLYTRVDKWDFKTGINAGEILETFFGNLPFGLSFQPGNSVIFVRQFKNQKKAMSALPVDPRKIPLNAQKALELDEGTFVSMPTYLNLITSISPDEVTLSGLEMSAGINFLVSSEYTIQIFKLTGERIRMKVIANSSKGQGLFFKIKLDPGIDFLTSLTSRLINNALDFEIFEVGANQHKGNMLVFDYYLDLAYPEVKEAFNAIIDSNVEFAPQKALDLFRDKNNIITRSVSNMTPLHKLFIEDREKPAEERRVDRIFEASNEYKRKNLSVSLDVKLFEASTNHIQSSNYIIHTDRNEIKSFYQFDSFSNKQEFNLFFSLYDSKASNNTYSLYEADQDGNLVNLDNTDFGISFEKKDEFLDRIEQIKIKDFLYSNLPESIFKQIKWNKIISPSRKEIEQYEDIDALDFFKKTTQRDGKVFWQIHFHKNILDQVFKNNDADLLDHLNLAIKRYLNTGISSQINLESLFPDNIQALSSRSAESDNRLEIEDLEYYKKYLIKLGKKYVSERGNTLESKNEKHNYLSKIQENNIFKKVGIALICSFMDQSELSSKINFSLYWTSDELAQVIGDNYQYSFGLSNHFYLYKNINFIKDLLENRSFDLRLVGYDPAKIPDYKHWLDIYEKRDEEDGDNNN